MQIRNLLLLAPFVTVCAAQNDPLSAFAQALNSNGLTAFAGLLPTLNQSTVGQRLFQTLTAGGNFSLFIPNNDAVSRVPANVASDGDTLANIVSYHVVPGNFSDSSGSITSETLPNVTVGRTLLNDSAFVQLEGNRSQVLVWGKNSGGAVRILNQPRNTTIQNTTSFGGFGIYAIDDVLTPPPAFSQALLAGNTATPSLAADGILGLLNNTFTTGADGNNVSCTSLLDGSAVRGFTFFVPNNAALQAAQSSLASLQSNATAVRVVLGNHIINGSTLYSTTLANATSASGEPLTFITNSTGTFVSSGNVATAQIVATNVLTKNGVLHIINGVLANTQSDDAAASSAFSQASATATQSASGTGPLTTPTNSNGNNGGNGNGNGNNGAFSLHARFSSPILAVVAFVTIAILV
ncbi:hypothetical protein V5O48_002927 [Marasmius crinis-equi]|uniref:FAS1 domain-containing protein n=1 Tax=Marasmius crinis-equi TaxID=585013 RepID=A0ABR3FUB9_9AGAR